MKKLSRNTDPTAYEKNQRKSDPLFASWYVTDPDNSALLNAFGRFEDALIYFLAR